MNIVEKHWVEMPDGVKLFTIVQRPAEGGRFPVIFMRSPYHAMAVDEEALRKEDLKGYVNVVQHCRGTALSEGNFIPYDDERRDGLAALDWVRAQPFYNGEIVLQGGSYTSAVHLAYLTSNPPDVTVGWLNVMDSERYNLVYLNGVFKCNMHGYWALAMYKKNVIAKRSYVEETFLSHPLTGFTRHVLGEPAPCIENLLLHESKDDPFWQTPAGGSEYRDAMRSVTFPLLLTGGFYDIFIDGMFRMWSELSDDIRRRCAFVVTSYDHDIMGVGAALKHENGWFEGQCPGFQNQWYDYVRLGKPMDFIQPGKVAYFPCFGREWRFAEFLEDGDRTWTLHLNENSLDAEPGAGGERSYVYNPVAPARFAGGVCNTFGGVQPQNPPDSRYDILSFIGPPVEARHLFEGRGGVRLRVKSDCPDTGFYVRLSVVKGDKTWPLREDITSLGRQHPDYRPGEEVWLDFQFAPHAFWLEPGDRFRLDVSSSCFPGFLPHTNRRGVQALQTGADIARNAVLLGCSTLTLHENTSPLA